MTLHLPSKVSGKSKWDDPKAKPMDLAKLAERNGRALTNPNMPLEALLKGAIKYPWYVEQNPALSLFIMENPTIKMKLHRAISDGWRYGGIDALSSSSRRQVAADGAEHILYVFKDRHPQYETLVQGVEAARKYAQGKINKESIQVAHDNAANIKRSVGRAVEVSAAKAVELATEARVLGVEYYAKYARWSLGESADAAGYFVGDGGEDTFEIARTNEEDWQTDRIRHYYAKENPEYKMHDVIGAKEQIGAKKTPKWSDPSIKPEELAKQAARVPRTYTNPNMSFEGLLVGARKYPWLVEQNPVLVLLQLEDPARYHKLKVALADGWLDVGLKKLSPDSANRLIVDCAEHVLPLIEANFASHLPRIAISTRREFMDRKASHEAVSLLSERIWEWENQLIYPGTSTINGPSQAILAVRSALHDYDPKFKHLSAIQYATDAIQYNARDSVYGREAKVAAMTAARDQEELWQADRIRFYYAKENPTYKMPDTIGGKKTPAWKDPAARPEQLAKQAEKVPKTYTNPNIPLESLLKGASTHPWLVEQNPLAALIALEDPTRGQELEDALSFGWWLSAPAKLKAEDRKTLALEIARKVLPIFEREFPTDTILREAIIEAANDPKFPKNTPELRELMNSIAFAASRNKYRKPSCQAAAYTVSTAVMGATPSLLDSTMYSGSSAVSYHVKETTGDSAKSIAALKEFKRWVADRLRFYFAKSHPGYRPPQDDEVVARRSRRDSIGAKGEWNDPGLSQERLSDLAVTDPRVWANPNVPPSLLIKAAKVYPWFVEQNMALDLMQLETPDEFIKLQDALIHGWHNAGVNALTPQNQRLLVADCAERVLPVYASDEEANPRGAKEVINTARRFTMRLATLGDLEAIRMKIRHHLTKSAYAETARKVILATTVSPAHFWPGHTQGAMRDAQTANSGRNFNKYDKDDYLNKNKQGALDKLEEIAWQTQCIRNHFFEQHPEMKLPDFVVGKATVVTASHKSATLTKKPILLLPSGQGNGRSEIGKLPQRINLKKDRHA